MLRLIVQPSKTAPRLLAPALLIALIASGCYNPDLGSEPFICASGGKRCPDGYSCSAAGRCVLPSQDAGVDLPRLPDSVNSKDAIVFLDQSIVQQTTGSGCSDHSSEPNNTSSTASEYPQLGQTTPGWQICYPYDFDHYKFEATKGDTIEAKIFFTHAKGDLDIALIGPDEFTKGESKSEDDDESITITAGQTGSYILGVRGFGSHTNTYKVSISVK